MHVEASEDLPQAYMPGTVTRLFELYEVVKQIVLVTTEDLFYCAPAWPKSCLIFCQQFLSRGLKSVEDNSEYDLAGMANKADGRIVLTLLEVVSLW